MLAAVAVVRSDCSLASEVNRRQAEQRYEVRNTGGVGVQRACL
jgi:hypothetical protein